MPAGLPIPRSLLLALLGVWFVAISVPLSMWSASHHALPAAATPAAASPTATADAGWRVTHILSASCGCSEVVAEYLIARRAQAGVEEHVWIVDGPATWEKPLSAAGFVVSAKSGEAIAADTGIAGAPWLLIRDGETVAYSGGYSTQPPQRGGSFEDLAIWRAVRAGDARPALPAYGCATSRFLKTARDPLGLKYSQ